MAILNSAHRRGFVGLLGTRGVLCVSIVRVFDNIIESKRNTILKKRAIAAIDANTRHQSLGPHPAHLSELRSYLIASIEAEGLEMYEENSTPSSSSSGGCGDDVVPFYFSSIHHDFEQDESIPQYDNLVKTSCKDIWEALHINN